MILLPGIFSQGGEKYTWGRYTVSSAAVSSGNGTTSNIGASIYKYASSSYTISGSTFSLKNPSNTRAENLTVGKYLVNVSTSSNSSKTGTTLYQITKIETSYTETRGKVGTYTIWGNAPYGAKSISFTSDGKISLGQGTQYYNSENVYRNTLWTGGSDNHPSNSSGYESGTYDKVYYYDYSATVSSGSGDVTVYEITPYGNYKFSYTSYKAQQVRGSYVDDSVSSNPDAYPDNGIQGDYWYVKYSDTPITWERYAMTEGEVQGESVTQTATSTTYFYRATSYSRSGKTFTATGTRTRASSLAVNNYLIQNNGEFVNSTSMSGDTLFKITKKSGSSTVSLTFDTYTVGDVKGSYIDTVTSYNPYEFPDDGAQDGYWYVKV